MSLWCLAIVFIVFLRKPSVDEKPHFIICHEAKKRAQKGPGRLSKMIVSDGHLRRRTEKKNGNGFILSGYKQALPTERLWRKDQGDEWKEAACWRLGLFRVQTGEATNPRNGHEYVPHFHELIATGLPLNLLLYVTMRTFRNQTP